MEIIIHPIEKKLHYNELLKIGHITIKNYATVTHTL